MRDLKATLTVALQLLDGLTEILKKVLSPVRVGKKKSGSGWVAGTRQGLLERHQQEARERDASRSFISVWSKSLPGMVFNGALCTISVIVSNLSSLALSSYFVSILPTKRNLLTHLNTVLVFVMAALVNALVRLSRIISKSSLLNEIYLFPVWLHLGLGHIPTLSISGDRPPVHLSLAFLTVASCSCCPQPHQDLPDTRGEQESRKELTSRICSADKVQPAES